MINTCTLKEQTISCPKKRDNGRERSRKYGPVGVYVHLLPGNRYLCWVRRFTTSQRTCMSTPMMSRRYARSAIPVTYSKIAHKNSMVDGLFSMNSKIMLVLLTSTHSCADSSTSSSSAKGFSGETLAPRRFEEMTCCTVHLALCWERCMPPGKSPPTP